MDLWKRVKRACEGRIGFVAEQVRREPPSSILDIGSGEGWLIGATLAQIPRRLGVDTDPSIVSRARQRYPDCDYRVIDGSGLPFASGEFDCAVLCDVIEHVGDDNKQGVIDEALRVLRPGGRLIVTVPHRGLWAPLDPLDIKRRAPRLYAVVQRLTGHQPLTPPDIGHKHVTLSEVEQLLGARANVEVVEYSGWCAPIGDFPWFLAQLLHRLRLVPEKIVWGCTHFASLEASLPAPPVLAGHLRLVARRSALG